MSDHTDSTNRLNFTKERLRAVQIPPKGKRAWIYDARVRGLAIQLTWAGTMIFYLIRKVAATRKTERMRLGNFRPNPAPGEAPGMTIEQARKQAESLNSQIAQGIDVFTKRKNERSTRELTFDELFQLYLDGYAKTEVKTWQEVEANYRRYFKKKWDKVPVRSIQKFEVQQWLNNVARIGSSKPRYATAHKCFVYFRAVLRWGMKKDLVTLNNPPFMGIDNFSSKQKERERFIQPGKEYNSIINSIEQEDPLFRDYFLLDLETGARKRNLLCMRWDEIQWELRQWHIPASKMKNADSHSIPLTDRAIEILQRRLADRERLASKYGEQKVLTWVFPSYGRTGHLVNVFEAWARIRERAGHKDVRIHDIRRTVGSYLAISGQSEFVIAKALGHRSLGAVRRYARLNQKPVLEALEKCQAIGMRQSD